MRPLLAVVCAPLLMAATFTPQQAAKLFGSRESIESISLSPDGSRLAYLAPTEGQGSALYTVDLATGASQVATAVDGDKQRLARCSWVSNQRLVCTVHAVTTNGVENYPVSRVVALNADGKDVKLLSQSDSSYQKYASLYGGGIIDWLPGDEAKVLMGRQYVPELRQKTRIERKEDGFGVDRIDTRTLTVKKVEPPRPNAVEYISDGRGNVRIMGMQPSQGAAGMAGGTVNYLYRTRTSKDWRPLGSYELVSDEGINPLAVDPRLDMVYALAKKDGRQALYRIALDGSLRKELVFAHPQVDVDGVITVGRSMRVVGASFATEKHEAMYFDPDLKRLANSLAKALPGLPLIRFEGSSVDEQKLLVWAGSDTDAGRYYLYEKATRKLSELMLSRPQLESLTLATVKAFNYKAADGTLIPAYLTLPPGSTGQKLPTVVLPHGGPSARDYWGFDWLAQFYANRGYAVLQPNFRGSGGYGDEWFKQNGFRSWRTAVGDVVDAGRWLVAEGIADPAKLAIVGWSYGGYAALQSNVVEPDLYKAIVAIAPVTDLNLLKEQHRNWSNFAIVKDFVGSGPHVREGSPAQNAARIKAPVLLFHGDVDWNVDVNASTLMRNRLRASGKQAELVVYPKLDHQLEDSNARADMLMRSEAFLRSAMKM